MDSSSVFLGVRIADMPYSRVCFKDVDLQSSVETGLRQRAADKFNLNEKELGESSFVPESSLAMRLLYRILFVRSLCLPRPSP